MQTHILQKITRL